MESKKQALNRADLNTLADQLRALAFGTILRFLTCYVRKSAVAAVAYSGASPAVTGKSTDVPAASIISAYARAGAGTVGPLTVVAYPPAAGQIAIAPNGAIVTAAADAWTSVDVTFVPDKGDVIEFTGDVVANSLALPTPMTDPGAIRLLEVESITGTTTGKLFVEAIGTAPGAGEASLNFALSAVAFNAGDAVTKARIKVLVCATPDVNLDLDAENTTYV